MQTRNSYRQRVRVITVVKMLWTHETQSTNHAKPHSIWSFTKIKKEIFVNICWQLKTPTRTWKYTGCTMQMGYLYASHFPFKNICKLAQHAETIRKKCLRKEQWRVPVVDKSTDHAKPHFDLLFMTISTSKKMFFSERELKKAFRDTLTRAAWYGLLSTTAN